MLAQIGVNQFGFKYFNAAAPALAPGTSVIPGASNVEGSWTQIASGANIAQDVYLMTLHIHSGATSGQSKMHLLDIGVDPAGGTSYVERTANIVCGGSVSISSFGAICGLFFRFPLFIPAGSSVAVRIQGSNATAGTVLVLAEFYGQPSHPELIRTGQYSETIGTITNSLGVSFTPGNSGAEGTWVSLGTTTRALWWWQLGVQLDNAGVTNKAYWFDLAYGDATNKVLIITDLYSHISTSETLSLSSAPIGFSEVPAGGELWVRGSCHGTTDTGWNAVAVGIGG